MVNRFTFFQNYYESMKDLPAESFKRIVGAMCEFAFNGTEPELEGIEKTIFMLVKPNLEKSMEIIEKRSAAGRMGAQVKREAKDKQNEAKPKQKEAKESRPRFVPPSVDEVKAYCSERGNIVDASRFVDFYTSKGWRIGNNPMRDWRAAVRTWEKRDKEKTQEVNQKVHNHQERAYDFEELERRLIKN